MRLHLRESHLKNNWFVDLWSDGAIDIHTFNARCAARFGGFHKLHKNQTLHPGTLPKYVEKMVNEAIELREFERLGE